MPHSAAHPLSEPSKSVSRDGSQLSHPDRRPSLRGLPKQTYCKIVFKIKINLPDLIKVVVISFPEAFGMVQILNHPDACDMESVFESSARLDDKLLQPRNRQGSPLAPASLEPKVFAPEAFVHEVFALALVTAVRVAGLKERRV